MNQQKKKTQQQLGKSQRMLPTTTATSAHSWENPQNKTSTRYNFLCSGVFMGLGRDLKAIMDDYPHAKYYDDQLYWGDIWKSENKPGTGKRRVCLDVDGLLVQSGAVTNIVTNRENDSNDSVATTKSSSALEKKNLVQQDSSSVQSSHSDSSSVQSSPKPPEHSEHSEHKTHMSLVDSRRFNVVQPFSNDESYFWNPWNPFTWVKVLFQTTAEDFVDAQGVFVYDLRKKLEEGDKGGDYVFDSSIGSSNSGSTSSIGDDQNDENDTKLDVQEQKKKPPPHYYNQFLTTPTNTHPDIIFDPTKPMGEMFKRAAHLNPGRETENYKPLIFHFNADKRQFYPIYSELLNMKSVTELDQVSVSSWVEKSPNIIYVGGGIQKSIVEDLYPLVWICCFFTACWLSNVHGDFEKWLKRRNRFMLRRKREQKMLEMLSTCHGEKSGENNFKRDHVVNSNVGSNGSKGNVDNNLRSCVGVLNSSQEEELKGRVGGEKGGSFPKQTIARGEKIGTTSSKIVSEVVIGKKTSNWENNDDAPNSVVGENSENSETPLHNSAQSSRESLTIPSKDSIITATKSTTASTGKKLQKARIGTATISTKAKEERKTKHDKDKTSTSRLSSRKRSRRGKAHDYYYTKNNNNNRPTSYLSWTIFFRLIWRIMLMFLFLAYAYCSCKHYYDVMFLVQKRHPSMIDFVFWEDSLNLKLPKPEEFLAKLYSFLCIVLWPLYIFYKVLWVDWT